MSSVQIFFPKNRLAKLLPQPGGVSVADALITAQEGLDSLADACGEVIDKALAEIDIAYGRWSDAYDAALLKRLYDLSNGCIGVAGAAGLAEMDRAAYSFCDLLDRMIAHKTWDRQAIAVHINALKLLRNPDLAGQESQVQEILSGLKKVRNKLAGGD